MLSIVCYLFVFNISILIFELWWYGKGGIRACVIAVEGYRLDHYATLPSVGYLKYVLNYFLCCVKENAVHIAIAIFLTIARGYYASLSSIYLFISVVYVCFSFHCRFRFFFYLRSFFLIERAKEFSQKCCFLRMGYTVVLLRNYFLIQNYAISVIQ